MKWHYARSIPGMEDAYRPLCNYYDLGDDAQLTRITSKVTCLNCRKILKRKGLISKV